MIERLLQGRAPRLEWFAKLSWLGRLNYYVLQWTGYRLAVEVDDDTGELVGAGFVEMRAGEGWIRNLEPMRHTVKVRA